MSVSTNGNLSYGCIFDEYFEFPWQADKYEGELEEWWMDVKGFVNPVECPYDEEGNYREGIAEDSVGKWLSNRRDWLRSNPPPVEVVNYCSGSYPMFIIAVKSLEATRGNPVRVNFAHLPDEDGLRQTLIHFLEESKIDYNPGDIGWWLSSYTD